MSAPVTSKMLIDGKPATCISALDRGCTYGDGVFRTMRTVGRHVAHWPLHYSKLVADCGRLNIPCEAAPVFEAEFSRLLCSQSDGVIRIVLTRGTGGRGYRPPDSPAPSRIVAQFPLPLYPDEWTEHGISARWCSTPATVQPALAGVKHLNRLDSVLARAEWSDAGIAEGLMLDPEGWVVQGTMSNIFIAEGSRLVTPMLDRSGVAGVQRQRVFAIAHSLGFACTEERISRDRLLAADQVCVTNSVIGMWWVARLDARSWQRRDETRELVRRISQSTDD